MVITIVVGQYVTKEHKLCMMKNCLYDHKEVQCFMHKKFFSGPVKRDFLKGKTSCRGNVKISSFLDLFLCFDCKQFFRNVSVVKITDVYCRVCFYYCDVVRPVVFRDFSSVLYCQTEQCRAGGIIGHCSSVVHSLVRSPLIKNTLVGHVSLAIQLL